MIEYYDLKIILTVISAYSMIAGLIVFILLKKEDKKQKE